MNKRLASEEQVKKALQINNFRELSKEKIIEFISLIPQMDKDVAVAIINQFPKYVETTNGMITQLMKMCDSIIKDNNDIKIEVVKACRKMLEDLGEVLKHENISWEERKEITNQMLVVIETLERMTKETDDLLSDVIKGIGPIIAVAMILSATILGVSVKGVKIPTISTKN